MDLFNVVVLTTTSIMIVWQVWYLLETCND